MNNKQSDHIEIEPFDPNRKVRINLVIPAWLKKDIEKIAEQENRSLNNCIHNILEKAVEEIQG